MTSTWRIVIGLVALPIILAFDFDVAAQPPAMPVQVAEALEMPMTSTVWAPGTVVSRNDARIAAEIAGRLVWVAEIGDEVTKGDVVARIDDRILKLALREAETRIKRLEVNARYLEAQQRRLETLEAEQIATPHPARRDGLPPRNSRPGAARGPAGSRPGAGATRAHRGPGAVSRSGRRTVSTARRVHVGGRVGGAAGRHPAY